MLYEVITLYLHRRNRPDRRAGHRCHLGLVAVITSYSIHYTKLYEILKSERADTIFQGETKMQRVVRFMGNTALVLIATVLMASNPSVITSYSIHYTKLYDFRKFLDSMGGF